MKIKKTIAIALSLALGACLFTGCAKGPSDDMLDGTLNSGLGSDNSQTTPSGEYTITFNANGGLIGTSSTVTCTTSGGKLSAGDVPIATRSGYEFDMWTDSVGNIFSYSTTYTANTTFSAQWKDNGNGGNDNNYGYGNGDDDDDDDYNYGYGDSSDITFIFSTGWDDAISDVRIHIWGEGEDNNYTDWNSDTDASGGDYMSDNYDGTYSYTVTVDYRGDIQGLVITFTQDGKPWYAKSTDCTYYFTAGETYYLTFGDWNNDIYGTIVWEGDDAWGIIPFDLYVS
ncbi:MAG: InlB B-repeat-containing protein [Clostridiales bacterium]|nr:InlB B-repeat-containing protein [Clostridiales bacterium]